MGNCGDGGIPFAEGAAGDGTVSQLRAYGPDELYRAVRDRCLYFSGFGLDWSHLGVFLSVLVCLAYTGVQIVFSHYWLKKFRYGPMEWLWRTGTYMKWQPLAR